MHLSSSYYFSLTLGLINDHASIVMYLFQKGLAEKGARLVVIFNSLPPHYAPDLQPVVKRNKAKLLNTKV